MKIRIFRGNSVPEVMREVKRVLGDDALILSVEECRDSQAGKVEILAAMDDGSDFALKDEWTGGRFPSEISFADRAVGKEIRRLRQELEALRRDLNRLYRTSHWEFALSSLVRQGVKKEVIEALVEGIKRGEVLGGTAGIQSGELVLLLLKELIATYVEVLPPIEELRGNPVFFVGPFGTGKTLALARLACVLGAKRREFGVGTLDPVAGKELLASYLEDVEVLELADLEELSRRLDSDREVLWLVDTPSFGLEDESGVGFVRGLLRRFPDGVVYLVLGLDLSREMVERTVRAIGVEGFTGYLFTKLDQGVGYGLIFNEVVLTRKPLSYFSMGKGVKDMEVATPGRIAELLLREDL